MSLGALKLRVALRNNILLLPYKTRRDLFITFSSSTSFLVDDDEIASNERGNVGQNEFSIPFYYITTTETSPAPAQTIVLSTFQPM